MNACGIDIESFVGISRPEEDVDDEEPMMDGCELATHVKALQRQLIFNRRGHEFMKRFLTLSSDVFVLSYPRCGLSWLYSIVFALQHMDDKGRLPETAFSSAGLHTAEPMDMDAPGTLLSFLENQTKPRLFATHTRPRNLPVLGGRSKPRVIIIARDPRDALVSTYFRLKQFVPAFERLQKTTRNGRVAETAGNLVSEMKDLTLEKVFEDFNDDGQDQPVAPATRSAGFTERLSLRREKMVEEEPAGAFSSFWCSLGVAAHGGSTSPTPTEEEDMDQCELPPADEAETTYGDYYSWYEDAAQLVEYLGPKKALLVHYEQLSKDPGGVIQEIANFLGKRQAPVVLSPEKLEAVINYASFGSTVARSKNSTALRKGFVGDHRIYLSKDHWEEMARKAKQKLSGHDILKPVLDRLDPAPGDDLVLAADWTLHHRDDLDPEALEALAHSPAIHRKSIPRRGIFAQLSSRSPPRSLNKSSSFAKQPPA